MFPENPATLTPLDPFDDEHKLKLLRMTEPRSWVLSRCEDFEVEYKANFSAANKFDYARILVSFANASGGYLVFGVDNQSRTIVGLHDDRLQRFDAKDLTQVLNSHFSPSIRWSPAVITLADDKKILIFYVFQSEQRPVIATCSGDDEFSEGDILYRYPGQTSIIRYQELVGLIDELVRKKYQQFMDRVQQLTVVDPERAHVLTDEQLRSMVVVDKGHFVETGGAPALQLISDATVTKVEHIPVLQKVSEPITLDAIMRSFYDQTCDNPKGFLQALAYQQTPYLPLWWFTHQLSNTEEEIAQLFQSQQRARRDIVDGLVKRVSHDKPATFQLITIKGQLPTRPLKKNIELEVQRIARATNLTGPRARAAAFSTWLSPRRSRHLAKYAKRATAEDITLITKAITIASPEILNRNIRGLLSLLQVLEIRIDARYKTYFRKALCYTDFCLYADKARSRWLTK